MNTVALISKYQDSLIERVIFAMLDNDNIIKAIPEGDKLDKIKNEIEDRFTQQSKVHKLNRNNTANWPTKYKEKLEQFMNNWLKDNPQSTVKLKEWYSARKDYQKNIEKKLVEMWNKEEPKKAPQRTKIIAAVLEEFYPEETVDSYKEQLRSIKEEEQFQSTVRSKIKEGERAATKDLIVEGRREHEKDQAQQKVEREEKRWEKTLSSYPQSKRLWMNWQKTLDLKNPEGQDAVLLEELLNLVGSLTDVDEEVVERLNKFLTDKTLPTKDEKALKGIYNSMRKVLNVKERQQVSRNVETPESMEAKLLGSKAGSPKGKDGKKTWTTTPDKNNKRTFRWDTGKNKTIAIGKKNHDKLMRSEELDLTNTLWLYNNHLNAIGIYWLDKMGMTVDEYEAAAEKPTIENAPKYPIPSLILANMYRIFTSQNIGFNSNANHEDAPLHFAYFMEAWQRAQQGSLQERAITKLDELVKFNTNILPILIKSIEEGIIYNPDKEEYFFNIAKGYNSAINKLSKKYSSDIMITLFEIMRGDRPSKKEKGQAKKTLEEVEDNILNKLSKEVRSTKISYAHVLLKHHIRVSKGTSPLVQLLKKQEEEEGEVNFLKPPKEPKKEEKFVGRNPSHLRQRSLIESQKETKKSLDTLLLMIGENDDILIKEDIGLILESLNTKQKKKVKTILNAADPTEYFGKDFLKLEKLLTVLKSLGIVKGDKKLRKKILRFEDDNLKVVKLATKLRKDYERLYSNLRELIYPKTGENKNE